MAERRSLIEGMNKPPATPIDPDREREFVMGAKVKSSPGIQPAPVASLTPARSPISTRIRSDLAAALKRASLERQLSGVEPNTLQDILEQAIEPWLKSNGYLT